MRDRVISLQHTLSDLGSSLVAEHVSGERNVVADHLSRVDVGDAFQLNQFVFADLQRTIGPCTIDRFATMANALLPVFNSYFLELGSSGVDAFAQTNWHAHVNFCYPPLAILGRLVNFLLHDVPSARCLVIAPVWRSAPWFAPLLLHASCAYWLPPVEFLFVRLLPDPPGPYVRNQDWRFVAVLLNVEPLSPPPFPTFF